MRTPTLALCTVVALAALAAPARAELPDTPRMNAFAGDHILRGLALGGGSTGTGGDGSPNLTLQAHLGKLTSVDRAFVLEVTATAFRAGGAEGSYVIAAPALQWWPVDGVWIRAGMGMGRISFADPELGSASGAGFAWTGALGIELARDRRRTIDLGVGVNMAVWVPFWPTASAFATLGVSWY